MLTEFRRILSASWKDGVDRCTDAARLWALDRAAADGVLQAYPEKRHVLHVVERDGVLIEPLPDYLPSTVSPDWYSDPIFDEDGKLSDFSRNGMPVSQNVGAFRSAGGESGPVHVVTFYARTERGYLMLFPSGLRRGDEWRRFRDKHLWEKVTVVATSSAGDDRTPVVPHRGSAYLGPNGEIAAHLSLSENGTRTVRSAEVLEFSLKTTRFAVARVSDPNTIPTSDILD